MPDLTAANVGRVVLLIATAVIAIYADRAITGRVTTETNTVTDTVTVGRAGTADDVPDATIPDVLTQYKAPDTTDTRTDCITVPTWLSRSTASGTQSKKTTKNGTGPKSSADTSGATSEWTPTLESGISSARSAGLSYDIIPTRKGRPALSVTSRKVQTSTLDPQTGAMSTWTYEVPEPTWTVTLGANAIAGRNWATVSTRAMVWRDTAIGDVGVGPAVGAVVADGVRSGGAVVVGFRSTLWSN